MLNKKKKADTGIVGTELKNELLKSACKNKLVHISTVHVYGKLWFFSLNLNSTVLFMIFHRYLYTYLFRK